MAMSAWTVRCGSVIPALPDEETAAATTTATALHRDSPGTVDYLGDGSCTLWACQQARGILPRQAELAC